MRLLILPRYSPLGASSRLRMYQYLPTLEAAGAQIDISPLLDDAYVHGLYAGRTPASSVIRGYLRRMSACRRFSDYDVVWIEKEALPWMPERLGNGLSGNRTKFVLDYDDAVFHRYDQHGNVLVRSLLGRKLDRLMHRADLVTAGNDYLASRARDAGCAHVEWLPTVIDLDRYPANGLRHRGGPVVVGWIGSPSTAGYLGQVAGALAPIQATGAIRCIAVGARPDQVLGTPFEAQPWTEETEVAALQGFDIGIMPLPDAPWERGKCGYKLIQYMACGLPVVASPVGVNTKIVRDGDNGWLPGSAETWAAAVSRLASDEDMRRRMGTAGRMQVEQTYSLQAQAPRLIRMLSDVAVEQPNRCVD